MLLPWGWHSITLGLIEYCIIWWNRLLVHRSNTIRITGVSEAVLALIEHNPIPTIKSFAVPFLDPKTVIASGLVVVRGWWLIAVLKQKLVAFGRNFLKRIMAIASLLIFVAQHWLVAFYVPNSLWKTYLLFLLFFLCFSLPFLRLHCLVVNRRF